MKDEILKIDSVFAAKSLEIRAKKHLKNTCFLLQSNFPIR